MKRIRNEVDDLYHLFDITRQQMNIVLGGYEAIRATKNGNEEEEEGAPIARGEEAEERGSAESDKGAPRHEPCIEEGNVAKAKPPEDYDA